MSGIVTRDVDLAVNLRQHTQQNPHTMKRNSAITLESVADVNNLLRAHINAKRGKSYYESVQRFEEDRSENLKNLHDLLLSGKYKTSEYRKSIVVDSGKERLISKLPYYPDRIVHWAIMLQMGCCYDKLFTVDSHAAIKGRGIHTALRETRHIMLSDPVGSKYCLKLDIKKFFPSINHAVLKGMISSMIKDNGLYDLNREIIDSEPNGLPIGNYKSQFYANRYLTGFDHWIKEILGVKHYVRYMDDIIIFAESSESLRAIYREVEWYLQSHLFLSIKDNWQIFPVTSRGVDYVGYRIWPNRVLLRRTTFQKLRQLSYKLQRRLAMGGEITDSEYSSLMARMGWLMHCTKKVRKTVYKKYCAPIIDGMHIKISKKMTKAFLK